MFPDCAFHQCNFDHAASLTCPFPSGGSFTKTDRKDCPDFMKVCPLAPHNHRSCDNPGLFIAGSTAALPRRQAQMWTMHRLQGRSMPRLRTWDAGLGRQDTCGGPSSF